jgi:3-hydroxyacyl-CoA dehydrogenase/enoyl-CoA hydratase/3-hydroxybutyryl-CoA epimerase
VSVAAAVGVERTDERAVSFEVRRDGVALVTIDEPRDPQGILHPAFRSQLGTAVARIDGDASVAAAVLVGGRADGFAAGVTLRLLKAVQFASDAEELVWELSQVLRRLAGLRKPVVSAVRGPVVGGALEIALACQSIIASDDATFAMSAVRAGLVPGTNGMLRVASRAGLRVAIDLAVDGGRLTAGEALAAGLVDDVCARAILVDAAARRARALVGKPPQPAPGRSGFFARAVEGNPLARHILLRGARERIRAKGGASSASAEQALNVLERFATSGFDAAARAEAKAFGELVVSESAHRLAELAFATGAVERDSGVDDGAAPRTVRHVAVIGGGAVGTDAAFLTLAAGATVRLKERDDKLAGLAMRRVKSLWDARIAEGGSTEREAEQAFARLTSTTDFSGVRHADAVLEAVPEDLGLKRAILRDVEALVAPACVYVSTTTSIPIARIAEAASRPERVVGMHFVQSPARASLVEVVRTDRAESWAIATAVALGKRQGNAAIVVKDGPGFYAMRVFTRLVIEALLLVGEGVAVDAIDAAATDWGFVSGPLRALDDVGVDVVARVAQGLNAAHGSRMAPPGSLARLVAAERFGRANRRGFYRYAPDSDEVGLTRSATVDRRAYDVLRVTPGTRLPLEEIQMRCALAVVNEAIRCLGDGVLRSPRDGDVGAVFGLGFPPFRGGPFRYVDAVGAPDILRRVQSYADRFGERWLPAPRLVHLAKRGDRFFG